VGADGNNGPVDVEPEVLARFSAPTRDWFTGAFAGPTSAQAGAWSAISSGEHALVVAPTGSGKTLAAFLWALDSLLARGREGTPVPAIERCRVLYVSPLKALAADVERNLRSPLVGIRQAATRAGLELADVRVGVRTGDTPPAERRAFATRPPHILITTPESLFLILTSAARAGLAGVRTVILDEIHAVAGTKRGAHLAVSLERLDALLDLTDSQITYRSRYLLGASLQPVLDLVMLDPYNPRSVAFQVERLDAEIAALPSLSDDGMLEEPRRLALRLAAECRTAEAGRLDRASILLFEQLLMGLSNAVADRYFLQNAHPEGSRMTRLA